MPTTTRTPTVKRTPTRIVSHSYSRPAVPMVQQEKGGSTMTLGDRCDEIVRLIDETLGSITTPVPGRLRVRRDDDQRVVAPVPTPPAGRPVQFPVA